MTAFCITYDLRAPGQDYAPVFEAIKAVGQWWHFLESTWLVSTTLTAEEVFGRIAPCIDENDYVLIIEVRRNSQGWLPKEAWEWIQTTVPLP